MNRVEDYARRVLDGDIVAGPAVRGECQRYFDDIKSGSRRGLEFDLERANHAIGFFEDVLTVEAENEVVPFNLIHWQAFVVGSLFGWYYFDQERGKYVRRFRTSYIETGKGSGKSPLAAGVGLYCMVADGVASAEVYAAATIKPQAMILFNDATKMVRRSPALRKRLTSSGGNPIWQWTHLPSSSIFKPLSKDEAVSGPRPNCALIDEYHEHKTADAVEMLQAGFKGRESPLLFKITNSGSDKTTPCGEMHDFAVKVATGAYDASDQDAADRLFTFVTMLDEGDDPLKDEACWPKANPSLDITIGKEYLRTQVNQARAMPARQNKILRLNFCIWTDAPDAWITRPVWEACETDLDLREMHAGDEAFDGSDLSFTTDMSAKATVWPWTDEKGRDCYDAEVMFWRPEDGLQQAVDRDRVRYDVWSQQGHLSLTEGKVIKLAPIAQAMGDDQDEFDLQSVAYDRYRHKELEERLGDQGYTLPMREHPQGFRRANEKDPATGKSVENPLWMPSSCQELENAIIEGRLRVRVNPVLRWNVASAVIRQDPAGTDNWIFDKRKATGRIDGLVALAMAIGAAKARKRTIRVVSPFEDENYSLVDA